MFERIHKYTGIFTKQGAFEDCASDCAIVAFEKNAEGERTITDSAVAVAAAVYFDGEKMTAEKRAEYGKAWKAAGNEGKFASSAFSRVLLTIEKNAEIFADALTKKEVADGVADAKKARDAADKARAAAKKKAGKAALAAISAADGVADKAEKAALAAAVAAVKAAFAAEKCSLTACKTAAESAAARATTKSARAAVESAAAVERRAAEAENAARAAENNAEKARAAAVKAEKDAAARVKAAEKRAAAAEKVAAGALNAAAVVEYVAGCNAAAFAAVAAAVDKRRAAEKAAARESAIDGVIRDAAKKGKTLSRFEAAKLWDNRTIEETA